MHFRDGFEPGWGRVGLWQGSCDSYSLAQPSREGSHEASLAPCADRGGLEIHRRQDTSLERQTGLICSWQGPFPILLDTAPNTASQSSLINICRLRSQVREMGAHWGTTADPDCLQALNIPGKTVPSEELASWSTNAPLSRKHRLAPASLTNAEFRRH